VLARALAFRWAVEETIADLVEHVPAGTVLRTPSLANAWSVNAVRIQTPQPGLDLDGLDALCARAVPDVPYRHALIDDASTGARLAPLARAAGWTVDLEVLMLLTRAPERDVDTSRVREGDLQEILDLTDTWIREEGLAKTEAEAIDVREMARREHAATPERRFVIEDPPGRTAAMTSLRERDRVGHLEDVYVLPDARGRGHARALVTHATAFARRDDHEVVFIVADAEGWPKDLYASVGFTPAGRRTVLHRDG